MPASDTGKHIYRCDKTQEKLIWSKPRQQCLIFQPSNISAFSMPSDGSCCVFMVIPARSVLTPGRSSGMHNTTRNS